MKKLLKVCLFHIIDSEIFFELISVTQFFFIYNILTTHSSLLDVVHSYPPTLFPLKKLFVGPYFSLKFTPTPNRCHRRPKEFCKKQCIFCEDTDMCVERIETYRTPSPCDKGIIIFKDMFASKGCET